MGNDHKPVLLSELPTCDLCGRSFLDAYSDEIFYEVPDEHGLIVCQWCSHELSPWFTPPKLAWRKPSERPTDGESIWVFVREWDGVNYHVEYAQVYYDTDGLMFRSFEGDDFIHWPPENVVAWMTCELPEWPSQYGCVR